MIRINFETATLIRLPDEPLNNQAVMIANLCTTNMEISATATPW